MIGRDPIIGGVVDLLIRLAWKWPKSLRRSHQAAIGVTSPWLPQWMPPRQQRRCGRHPACSHDGASAPRPTQYRSRRFETPRRSSPRGARHGPPGFSDRRFCGQDRVRWRARGWRRPDREPSSPNSPPSRLPARPIARPPRSQDLIAGTSRSRPDAALPSRRGQFLKRGLLRIDEWDPVNVEHHRRARLARLPLLVK